MVNALKELTNVKELINQVLLFTPKIVMSLLILFLFWLASVILEGVIHRLFEKPDWGLLALHSDLHSRTYCPISLPVYSFSSTIPIGEVTIFQCQGLRGLWLKLISDTLLSSPRTREFLFRILLSLPMRLLF
jgi:hypothetical protein